MALKWLLLALCSVLDAMYSVMNFFTLRPDGSLGLRLTVRSASTLTHMGELALAAGVCTIAVGVWNARNGKSWFLVLNGLACSALGLIFTFGATSPIRFRTVALLIVVMALSLGIFELGNARWFLSLAGSASVGFAVFFTLAAFRWIALDPTSPAQSLHWVGSYFAFTAIGMLMLSLRKNPAPRLS
jgi:hypothetical protein